MPRLRPETRARARALQALYAWDLRDGESLERVASQVWDDLAIAPDERKLASQIVRTVIAEGKAIDDALRDVTTNWRLERVGAVERAVLRLAAAELLRGEPPPRVTIQEAVRLAERYGSTQSARFVNGVLDALARRMGRL
jgi:transcription antitermination protein NusB